MVFICAKKDLTKRYHQTLSEIEDIRNALLQIGNDEKWLDWVDNFSKQIRDSRDIPDQMKKELLKLIVDNIIVNYDHIEKVHRLTINFKLPVVIGDKNGNITTNVIVNPPKLGRKRKNQLEPVGDYSTVVISSPDNPKFNHKKYSLRLSVELIYANLWVAPYTSYQQELFDIITKFHDVDGWNFQQISNWLNDNGYSTPRGRIFTHTHAWSIYRKKNRSILRFSREYDDTIKDMRIDVVDYLPIPIE